MKGTLEGAGEVPVEPLRRLARQLLYDRHQAEDVVQEAWLAALQAQGEVRSLGDWLAGVIRRLASQSKREAARRDLHERGAARPEAEASRSEASSRIEILRRLIDAVDGLEEPYRTAIALRFFDELPPREMARRLGVPVNTARTHVRRGLERLRSALDGEGGRDRQDFLAAVAPFAGGAPWTNALGLPVEPWSLASWSGALFMKQKIVIVTVLCLLCGGFWTALESLGDGRERGGRGEPLLVEAEGAAGSVAVSRVVEPQPDSEGAERRSRTKETKGGEANWIVRGRAVRRPGLEAPGMWLVGRVHAGPRSTGEVLVEERFQADEAGGFTWGLMAPEQVVTLTIESLTADHHRHPRSGTFVPGDSAPKAWLVRACPTDATLHGTVRDSNGSPIPGAHVETLLDEVTCDPEGRFRLPASSYHDTTWVVAAADGFAQARMEAKTVPGENPLPDLVLSRELVLSGRVLDESGVPIEGALVTSHSTHGAQARSDAEGAFVLGGFDPADKFVSAQAHKEGFVDGECFSRMEEAEALEIRLAKGVRLTGQVRGSDGAPIAHVRLGVGEGSYHGQGAAEGWSDAAGAFAIEGVPPGTQRLWALRTGYAETSRLIEVASAEGGNEALEVILEDEHFLAGLVLDARGEPLPWAWVYAEDALDRSRMFVLTACTDSEGRFRLGGLPEIEVSLAVEHPDHAYLTQEVSELDRQDLVLRLAARAGFGGRVVDAVSGVPIPSFTVHVRFPAHDMKPGAIPSLPPKWIEGVPFEDPDGRWMLLDDHAPGALVALEIEAPGYAPSMVEDVPARPLPESSDLVVALSRGTLVRGHVVAKETGQPIPGVRLRRFTERVPLRALENWEESLFEAVTDATGAFEIRDLPTGEMWLSVEHEGWPPRLDGPFTLEGASPQERWIELSRGGVVTGQLVNAAGRPLAGETVSLNGHGLPGDVQRWEATTEFDGSFQFTGLPSGGFHLRWVRHFGPNQVEDLSQAVVLEPGQALEVVMGPKGRATLRAGIQLRGEMPPFVALSIRPLEGESGGRETVAENGSFVLEGFEPGRYVAFAYLDSPPARSAPFVVPESGEVSLVIDFRAP